MVNFVVYCALFSLLTKISGDTTARNKVIMLPLKAGKIGFYHGETLLLEKDYAKELGVSQKFTPYEIKWSLGDEYIVVKSSTSEETMTIRKEKILSSSFNN